MPQIISRWKALFSIYFVSAIDNMGYGIVIALFAPLLLDPKYHFLSSDVTHLEKIILLGGLYAAYPLSQFFGAPLLGDLADQYGRRRIFFITISASILGYFLTGFALNAKSIVFLICARAFSGLFAGNVSLCTASIADLSPNEKQRARNYGILTVTWGLSFPIAIFFSGYFSNPTISSAFSPSLPFHLLGCLTVLSLMMVYFFYPETFKASKREVRIELMKAFHHVLFALRKSHEKRYFFLLYLWTLGWCLSIVWYGTYVIQQFAISQERLTIGLIFQGLCWTLGGAVINPLLLKRLQIQTIAKLVLSLTALLLFASSWMDQWIFFTSIYSAAAIFGSVGLTCCFNLISTSFPATVQGKAMGIAQSMVSFGAFCVPILGAALGSITIDLLYPSASFFMFLALCMLLKKG